MSGAVDSSSIFVIYASPGYRTNMEKWVWVFDVCTCAFVSCLMCGGCGEGEGEGMIMSHLVI